MQYKNSFSVFHMKYNLTGLVAAVRDSISACVIQMLLVDCNSSAQIISLCLPPVPCFLTGIFTQAYRASACGCRWTGEGDHFLNG